MSDRIPICAIPPTEMLKWLACELYALGYQRDGYVGVEAGLDSIVRGARGWTHIYLQGKGIWFTNFATDASSFTIMNSPRHMVDYLKRAAARTS